VKSNINKIYIANFLTGVVFWYPVEKLFMRTIGISPFGVGINAVVLLSITILLDVPAGILADRWKRTYTLVIALVSLALSSLVLGLSHSLAVYLIGTCFYGIYLVCTSGTYQALMYDSLTDIGEQEDYDKYQGRSYALFLAGVSISSLMGGYIAVWVGYRASFFLSIIPAIITVFILFSIAEPKKHKLLHDNHYIKHVVKGFSILKANPLVLNLAIFSVIAGVLRSSQNEFAGLYYIALGLTAIPSGYVNSVKWLSGAVGQVYARRIGRRAFILIPVLFICFLVFTLIHSVYGLIFFMLAVLLQAILANQAEAEIQTHIKSETRATTLSAISFLTNLILIPLGLAFGWLAGKYSPFKSYQLIALVGIVYLIYWLFKGRKQISVLYGESLEAKILQPTDEPRIVK
jgi:MFS family permease